MENSIGNDSVGLCNSYTFLFTAILYELRLYVRVINFYELLPFPAICFSSHTHITITPLNLSPFTTVPHLTVCHLAKTLATQNITFFW